MTKSIWKSKLTKPTPNAWIITKWEDDGKINYEIGLGFEVVRDGLLKACNCLGWRYAFGKSGVDDLEQENSKLKQALSIANEALAFYASCEHINSLNIHPDNCTCYQEEDITGDETILIEEGIKAIEAQQKIKELGV